MKRLCKDADIAVDGDYLKPTALVEVWVTNSTLTVMLN